MDRRSTSDESRLGAADALFGFIGGIALAVLFGAFDPKLNTETAPLSLIWGCFISFWLGFGLALGLSCIERARLKLIAYASVFGLIVLCGVRHQHAREAQDARRATQRNTVVLPRKDASPGSRP